MVAGTTPLSLIIFSTDRAVLKLIAQLEILVIYNYPWKMENNSQLVESLWFGCMICFILIQLYKLVLMFKLFDFLVPYMQQSSITELRINQTYIII